MCVCVCMCVCVIFCDFFPLYFSISLSISPPPILIPRLNFVLLFLLQYLPIFISSPLSLSLQPTTQLYFCFPLFLSICSLFPCLCLYPFVCMHISLFLSLSVFLSFCSDMPPFFETTIPSFTFTFTFIFSDNNS